MSNGAINPRRPVLAAILSGILAITTLTLLDGSFPEAIQRFDAVACDYLVSYAPTKPTGKVVIAAIDDSSIGKLGPWSWRHSLEARLVDRLRDYRVSVIGIDVWFVDKPVHNHEELILPGTVGTPNADDDALSKAIIKQGSTYIGYLFNSFSAKLPFALDPSLFTARLIKPPPLTYDAVLKAPRDAKPYSSLIRTFYGPPSQVINIAAARHTAFLNVDLDLDGNVRSFPTVFIFHGLYCAPFFLALADAFLGQTSLRLIQAGRQITGIALANRTIPVDEMGRMIVRFRGPEGTFLRYSAVDIINHKISPSALRGKIVLVGVTASGVGDHFATPVDRNLHGVEIQANAVDNVLAGDFLYRSRETDHTERIIGWIMAGIITLAAVLLTARGSFLLSMALLVGIVVYSKWRIASDGALIGFGFSGLAIAVTYAAVATTRWRTIAKQKKYTRWVADHYLSPKVFAQVEIRGDNPGVEEDATIMFADLSGFTLQSQIIGPKALTEKVNRYFSQIVLPVDASNGHIERFLGDAMLAFWTDGPSEYDHLANKTVAGTIRFLREKWRAPISVSNHAVRAIRAGIAIVEGVKLARAADEARSESGFTIKVGINSGPALIGNVGSGEHFSYSLMGKDVNFAARLESVPPLYGCNIVVGENAANVARDEFLLRELDWILVKGAEKPIAIYQPIADRDQANDAKRELVASFSLALEHYRAGRFAEACSIWDELVAKYEPAPSPSSVMAARARDCMTRPPPLPWNAIYVLKSK